MTRRRFPAIAIIGLSHALFLGGCLHDGGDGGGTIREGIILRSCGPADGAQLDFHIDSLPMDCRTPRQGIATLRLPDITFDSLRVGRVFIDSTQLATNARGLPHTEWLISRVEIREANGDTVIAAFRRIRTGEDGAADTTEGTARLKECREVPPPLCG